MIAVVVVPGHGDECLEVNKEGGGPWDEEDADGFLDLAAEESVEDAPGGGEQGQNGEEQGSSAEEGDWLDQLDLSDEEMDVLLGEITEEESAAGSA